MAHVRTGTKTKSGGREERDRWSCVRVRMELRLQFQNAERAESLWYSRGGQLAVRVPGYYSPSTSPYSVDPPFAIARTWISPTTGYGVGIRIVISNRASSYGPLPCPFEIRKRIADSTTSREFRGSSTNWSRDPRVNMHDMCYNEDLGFRWRYREWIIWGWTRLW